MDIIEREIKQDLTISDPLIYIMAGIVVCFMLFAAVVSRSLVNSLFFVGVAVFLIIFTWMCLRGGLQDMLKSGKTWWLTNAGLKRIYPKDKAEIIRWDQIRRIKWVRFTGLIVRWEEPKAEHQHRCASFKDEFKYDGLYHTFRAKLRVQKDEAGKLLSIAERKTGTTYQKPISS